MRRALAVVFTDRLKVELREVDVPDPTDQDVVIDVQHSWISIGTESSYLRGERISGEQARRESDPWPFPHVAGYQKVGVVREVGAAVHGLRPGDRVFASVSHVKGMYFPSAGHISPAVTNAGQVWKLPDSAPPLAYAGLVLTQVGYNCGTRPAVHRGDRAVVIGDGLVGQWTAQTLLHRGAQVTVLGRHEERLQYVPQGTKAVNVRGSIARSTLAEGDPIAIVVDTVGDMDTVHALHALMGHDSHFVSAGFLGQKGWVDIQALRGQEMTLHTPSGWSRERMDRTREGIQAGWLSTVPLITHRFPIADATDAWEMILTNKATVLGVVLDW